MVAPLGPASAEALKFTFVRPFAGACTMTCVSTVSPRALDRLMKEAVPGAPVCPTLIRPGDTHTGNGTLDDWLAAIKIVRPTTTAAKGRHFTSRKVQRACPPFCRVVLESIFMGVLLPAINFRAGEELTIGAILSVARLRDTLDAMLARSAPDVNRVGLVPGRRVQAYWPSLCR